MAQKAIREYFGKNLLYTYLKDFAQSGELLGKKYSGVRLTTEDMKKQITLPDFPEGFVAKPDELFGKRGKNNLVFVGKTKEETLEWIHSKAGKTTTIIQNGKQITGALNNFLVEPYIEHEQEFYIAIKTSRYSDIIYFSSNGGVDVEENWDKVTEIKIPFKLENQPVTSLLLSKLERVIVNQEFRKQITEFISALYQTFKLLNFTYLEVNPFVIKDSKIYLLDLVARLDDTAWYQNKTLWEKAGNIEFPASFGNTFTQAEKNVAKMDAKSGASLKYKLLNHDGSIWLLTSGGGGSVIFADTVGDLGFHNEIANYCDYSGNPNTDETREFCENLFSDMLSGTSKNKILIIAGGIANFTDVAKTFSGVGQAIEKFAQEFRKQNIKIYVRRGGPNYKKGLEFMKSLGQKFDIQTDVYGPEMYMTEVVKLALKSKS